MARISLIEPAQASAEVKEIYDSKFKGNPGNIQKALAHRPAMLGKFLGILSQRGTFAGPQTVRGSVSASLIDQWMPLLHAASHSGLQTRGADTGADDGL
jgi:hypothetical protein